MSPKSCQSPGTFLLHPKPSRTFALPVLSMLLNTVSMSFSSVGCSSLQYGGFTVCTLGPFWLVGAGGAGKGFRGLAVWVWGRRFGYPG